ncbi:MAG TPA: sn-glycerol-3-phosphate ABC transporter ATP-binding protein UgpC [Anaeromyxobacteraceae bacterium]|nr:sn-glycerol-3-phosphate ABC transporter ATP-binding protein UgpC [Anaeromyxobacteraceae bacterium]
MAGVTLEKVTKRFGETSVIEAIDLAIQDHEFMVLVGPSGCGKSTLLRMVAGLEEITSGSIAIGERVVNDVPPKDRDIAMVFQNYALYPHMTVRENLEFGLKIRKTARPEIDRLVKEASEILGIVPLLTRRPKQLSGGQRQRVALGRAIVRKPAVFLFDEPLSNLDAKLRVQMRAEIKKLQLRLGTTAIYVTHDQVEAMTMGHRIAVLHAGKLQQVGAPLQVYERPANLFVANFIGTPPMNFVKGTLGDGGAALEASSFRLPLPQSLRASTAGKAGRKVVLGVRPEHVLDAEAPARGETAPLELTVEIVETLGDELVVHGRSAEDTLVFRRDAHRAPEVGSKVKVKLELSQLHLFDAETELRLAA